MSTNFQRAFTETLPKPPIWLMRQAGRYLPEYRETRAKAGDFLSLCYNPELACEVTLQPIRRFDFDAAIIFSDILVVLQAMGQKLWFEEGEGPRLGAADWQSFDAEFLTPVYEAIGLTRQSLPKDKSLIGFAGAPWTLLLYALEGKGGDFANARKIIAQNSEAAQNGIDTLTDAVIDHLSRQIDAGCDVVQIFDSWASYCPEDSRNDYIFNPARKIVDALRGKAKVIAFPKGISNVEVFVEHVKPDAVGFDQHTPIRPMDICVQGNLNPVRLIEGGDGLEREIDAILQTMQGHRHIFNLGHGIDKTTPIENVELLIKKVRA